MEAWKLSFFQSTPVQESFCLHIRRALSGSLVPPDPSSCINFIIPIKELPEITYGEERFLFLFLTQKFSVCHAQTVVTEPLTPGWSGSLAGRGQD